MSCNEKGRGHGHFPSWGKRRRRDVTNADESIVDENNYFDEPSQLYQRKNNSRKPDVDEEEVHELFRVYLSHADVPDASVDPLVPRNNHHLDPESSLLVPNEKVCLTSSGYYTLVTCITVLVTLLLSLSFAGVLAVKNGKKRPLALHHHS